MKNILFLIITIPLLFGCSDSIEIENSTDIQGEYIGTFQRDDTISNVTLNFANGNFSGEVTSEQQSPRICNGTYTITTNAIIFTNTCLWTAEFDWSLILNNTWQYQLRNDILTLVKENGDTYILTKI